jgi:hypothetical protein
MRAACPSDLTVPDLMKYITFMKRTGYEAPFCVICFLTSDASSVLRANILGTLFSGTPSVCVVPSTVTPHTVFNGTELLARQIEKLINPGVR